MRVVKEDFEELKIYIESFSLKQLLNDANYVNSISTCHKKYYCFFIASSEFQHCFKINQYQFLKESNSDLATSLFHIMTGSYKSARLLLRSSIECFFKSFVMDWLPSIEKEKSVFEIFNKIKAHNYFAKNPQKSQFNSIHSIYKDLCKDVHVSDQINMAQIDALDLLPSYTKGEANKISEIYLKLISAYLFLLCNKYNLDFHRIHYVNKEIILMGISKTLRPVIMNIQ